MVNPAIEASPVSRALEEALSSDLRRHGHVLWLDREGDYSAFTDALAERSAAGAFPWPVVRYRGSFLETMFALEPYGSALDKTPLLIHAPGHNKESIRKTPLLETYESSRIWQRALPTLVRETAAGRVAPTEIDDFLATPGLTVASADAWLHRRLTQHREGLDGQLARMSASLLAEELLGEGGRVSLDLRSEDAVDILQAHLERLVGLDREWLNQFPVVSSNPQEKVQAAFWRWILCVEYVNDLKREPHVDWLRRLRALPAGFVQECQRIAQELRTRAPDKYVSSADEVENRLEDERRNPVPQELGDIDTFRFEVAAIFEGALDALEAGQWEEALGFSKKRAGDSFWLRRDAPHRHEWELVASAAELGRALGAAPAPLARAGTVEEAVDAYARLAAPVDREHRRLEQTKARLLEPSLPNFLCLKNAVAGVEERHRAWADDLARAWTRLCGEVGFLPPPGLQQRTLFEQVVEPLARSGDKVAFFLVDAFRFEMASEVIEDLKAPGAQVELRPRLAELPTLTSVGMNALAPVGNGGKLSPVLRDGDFRGFRAGEYTVSNPEQRARAMGQRLHGEPALKLDLATVIESDTEQLKRRVAQSRGLIVVHSKELDDAGENGFGPLTFEQSLQQIKAAIGHLQRIGIRQFVVTADHGFLLQDGEGPARAWGTTRVPSRRHVVTPEVRKEVGTHCVSLSGLGYEGVSEQLVFNDDTRVFDTGKGSSAFVHGGDSLQERVIPVLVVTRKRELGSAISSYAIEAEGERDLMGQRHLRFKVVLASQAVLGFAAAREISISLRARRENVSVLLKDVSGSAEVRGGTIRATVGAEIDVYFALEGPADERVQVELFHPEGTESVKSFVLKELFEVNGVRSVHTTPQAPPRWQDAFPDPAIREVFEHLERYDVITETELVQKLGNPRAVRRFAASFDGFLSYLPFEVRVESTPNGKRYVKGGARDVAQS